MITNLLFKSGATAQSKPLSLMPESVTVFVGPNNAGKSQALAEIWSKSVGAEIIYKIFQNIDFIDIEEDKLKSENR